MKFIRKIILKFLPINEIESLIDKNRIRRCELSVSLGSQSRFYKEAQVSNLQEGKFAINIGNGTHIRGELLVFAHGGKIEIGDDSYVGVGTRIWSAEHVKIGNNVLISHNCNIIDTDSHEIDHIKRSLTYQNMIKNGHAKVNNEIVSKSIIIEDYAWLSFNVSILKGVKIGRGAIVAAGSVVTKDVNPFTMVAGNPAKYIKSLPNN